MTYYDDNLRRLQEKVKRKKHLESKLLELSNQRKKIEPRLKLLEINVQSESVDVEKLENKTLTSIFYGIIGKKEEKLEKERAEAYACVVKRDNAKRELDEVNFSIEACEKELEALKNCEREYSLSLNEKLEAVRKSGIYDADYTLALEEKIAYCENQIKEIEDAVITIKAAQSTAEEILSELSDAEGWGEIDMFTGGKLADIQKHSHLDNAEMLTIKLKRELSDIKAEIADIDVELNSEISLSEFSSTADWLFDNIFTASAVLDQIQESKTNISNTLNEIDLIFQKLQNIKCDIVNEKSKYESELEK